MKKKNNEINFRLAIEAARIGTWERDLSTNLIVQSPITSQILGHGEGETVISFKDLESYTFPEDMERFREPLNAAIESGEPFDVPFRIWRPDGKVRWITVRGMALKDDSGKPAQVVGVMFDITEKKQAEERFRLLTEYSPDSILVELNSHIVYVNPAAKHLLGIAKDNELLEHPFLEFIHPDFHERFHAECSSTNETNPISSLVDLQTLRPDGSVVNVQAVCGHLFWDGQAATQIMLRDVTELKKSRDQVQHLSDRLKLVIEGMGEGIWEWNVSNDRVHFSGGFGKIIGWGEDFDTTLAELYAIVHPDDLSKVQGAFQKSLHERVPLFGCEYRIKALNNDWKWVNARGVIVERDKNGEPLVMAGILTDITSQKVSDELSWKHANLDALTSLPNRRLFHECLQLEIRKARHANSQIALLFIDLDGFKLVNDLYGHDLGDSLLIEAARRIKACVGNAATVGRIGGDEFIVMLSDLHRIEHIDLLCPPILASLTQAFQLGENESYVSASIGISLYPLDASEAEELIRKADQAMHVAKRTGRNRFAYFTRELDERSHERLRILNELRMALGRNQFEVHYQPIVDLKNNRVIKAEALLRWTHPVMGPISPSLFIPLAEELGIIVPIGNWMFKEAVDFCKQCASVSDCPLQLSVNMSPLQFMSEDNDADWVKLLSDAKVAGDAIVIEITEGVLLNTSDKVFNKFKKFKHAGIQVALDDFGTGYSSMSYLQKFDIDYIKIDKSFVQDMTASQGSRTIAETIIVMAHKLGKKVIAEGIETTEQLNYLVEAGCDYGQGFLFSKAVPASDFMKRIVS